MADIIDENMSDSVDDTQAAAKNIVARHPLRTGAAAMAAIFGTGYMIGHKHAESKSLLQKIMGS